MDYPASILRKVKKPGQYVGGEFNIIKKDPSLVDSLVALVFPDTYEIGMSHLGSRFLYHVLNHDPKIAAERFFCPQPDMERELINGSRPLLSLENHLPLNMFHVVGFSILYELTFTNILTILNLGGIPFYSCARKKRHPLVVGGGPAASNPEPIADFFDLVLLGDGEDAFPEIIRLDACLRKDNPSFSNRLDFLRNFMTIEGVYVPAAYRVTQRGRFFVIDGEEAKKSNLPVPVKRIWIRALDAHPMPDSTLVPNTSIVHDRVTAEISRGCMQGCRFCHASIYYRPQRERNAEQLVRWILQSLRNTGYKAVSLSSLSTGDFGGIVDLVEILIARLENQQVGLMFPSLRVSELSARLTEAVAKIRKTGFTVAPEAGTQRMRDVINKGLSEQEILNGVLSAYRSGWDLIKLYFMIGLPFENDNDVAGIAELVRRLLKQVRGEADYQKRKRKFQINLSISPFVPKPHTPFQWAAMNSLEQLKHKIRILTRLLSDQAIKISWHDPETNRLEAVFSRGDRSLSSLIEAAWKMGARLDGWGEHFNSDIWTKAFRETNIEPSLFLDPIDMDDVLPWHHLDLGIGKSTLRSEWLSAGQERPTPPCGFSKFTENNTHFTCTSCGVGCSIPDLVTQRRRNLELLKTLKNELKPLDSPGKERGFKPYRFAFTKQHGTIWLSHLDLIRTIQRILIRANLKIKFTEGFHPRPNLGFSPALGVGIGSRAEYVDAWIADQPEPEDNWLRILNDVTVPGIKFFHVTPLPPGAPSIEKWAVRASYRLELSIESIAGYLAEKDQENLDPVSWTKNRIHEILNRKEIILQKTRKGKRPRIRDVRPFILDSFLEADSTKMAIFLTSSLGSGGSLRIDDWLAQCFPGYEGDYLAERVSLEGENPF